MLIASMVVKVLPEKAEAVQAKLDALPGVTTYGVHKENNIIAVAEVSDVDELERLSKGILADNEEVMAVLPTFLGSDQESFVD